MGGKFARFRKFRRDMLRKFCAPDPKRAREGGYLLHRPA